MKIQNWREALEYYRTKAPEVKPPQFMLTKEWADKKSSLGVLKFDEEETEEEDGQQTPMEDPTAMEMESMSAHSDANEKAKQICEIFTNVSMAAALIALKKSDYDVDAACCQLADGAFLNEIMKEAEDSIIDGENNPNKKQRTQTPPMDLESVKSDNRLTNGKRSLSQ